MNKRRRRKARHRRRWLRASRPIKANGKVVTIEAMNAIFRERWSQAKVVTLTYEGFGLFARR